MSSSYPNSPPLPYQVSELLALLHQRVDAEFGAVRVEGEVGSLTQARSGHRYFALKDLDGQIRCAWFRSSIRGIAISEGQKIVAHGRLAIYTPRGDLQLIVSTIEDVGDGALAAAFQRLKKKLQAEGLFEEARKPPLPLSVLKIHIICSPQAAALQDVLVALARRDPFMQVELHPVPVQGPDAPGEISRALQHIGSRPPGEVVLLTRGGGSLEDLQAFNTEIVARAIADCPTPVVSAVGHEVDFSISDFVASLRAATPTAAAELLSTDRSAQARQLLPLRQRLRRGLERQISLHRRQQQQLLARLQRQAPRRRIETNAQRLDSLMRRLGASIDRTLKRHRESTATLGTRLARAAPRRRTQLAMNQLLQLRQRMHSATIRDLQSQGAQLSHLRSRLESLNPRRVLDRGYAIVHHGDTLLTRRSDLADLPIELRIEWADGSEHGQFTKL